MNNTDSIAKLQEIQKLIQTNEISKKMCKERADSQRAKALSITSSPSFREHCKLYGGLSEEELQQLVKCYFENQSEYHGLLQKLANNYSAKVDEIYASCRNIG